MQKFTIDPRRLAQEGMAALQAGNPQQARACFEKVVEGKYADASIFLALAYACKSMQDASAATSAIDNVLLLEPQNLRALLFKADHLAEAGDRRAASAFYLAAIKAVPPAGQVPADLRQAMLAAQAFCDRQTGELETMLHAALADHGVDQPGAERFNQSLDILFGRKQIYLQEPRYYYFPGLPQVQFYPRDMFPWLDQVEAMAAEIRLELDSILRQHPAFQPYVQGDPLRPRHDPTGMLNNPDWGAFYLMKDGNVVEENAARCPRTMGALRDVPLALVGNRSPSILFSLLRPGARIPPHTGFVNTRLICHLPLIIPPQCGFRVGNETRQWVEGKAWVFDDTIEHEAWNLSNETRVILLFDVWRPELSAHERDLVRTMLEALDRKDGDSQSWGL